MARNKYNIDEELDAPFNWHQFKRSLVYVKKYRKQIILNIEPKDYIEGPIVDTLNKMGEMWVFGKNVKKQEVYIKIMLGQPNSSTICISFHIAEHPLNYPFKN